MKTENEAGGFAPGNEFELKVYRMVDLVTLPNYVKGTNCSNCKWFDDNYCGNPAISVPVNEKMCCNAWDAAGTIRY